MSRIKSKLNISELDFDTIKTNLVAFLESQSEFKNYNFKGATMDVLMDILSYNTHYNAFYMNMLANEMFLETASLRSSVVSKARTLGYTPKSARGSLASVNVRIFPTDNPSSITIPRYTQFNSTVNDRNYTFVSLEAVNITPANGQYYANNLQLKQGIPFAHRYVVNTADKSQKYIIPNVGCDTTTMNVTIQTSNTDSTLYAYTEATDILTVNAAANVYFIEENREGKFEVLFGDGVLGNPLVDGNIVILESLITAGDEPNGAFEFAVDNISGYSNVVISTSTVGTGGSNREGIQSIKYTAPRRFETQNRAVTQNDYKRIIEENYTEAESIIVWGGEDNDPPVYGKVFVAIKPTQGSYLSESAKNFVINDILKPRSIVSTIVEVVNPIYTNVVINCTTKYNEKIATSSAATIKTLVETTIKNYVTNRLNLFNQQFRFSNLLADIDVSDRSILSSLVNIQMKYKFDDLRLNIPTNYDVKFNNEIYHPYTLYEGSITSSIFSHKDSLGVTKTDCKFEDVNGIVKIIRIEGNEKFDVVENIGTIDYSTGIINLINFSPTSITGSVLTLTATPASSDIIPKNNQILRVDDNDILVKILTDSVDGTNLGSNTATSGAASGGVAGSGGSSSSY